jgi:hypothetical protein
MRVGISGSEWRERARKLNLEWVNETPVKNDQQTPIRCLDCGHQWSVFPANIAKGRKSCEPCSRASSRVSSEAWVSRLAEIQARWIKGTPETISDKSKLAKCDVCQGVWAVNPRRISKGHPRCKGKVKPSEISEELWKDRARQVGIQWKEVPSRSKVRTPAQCLTCGHTWSPIPDNIRSGSGCPKCALKNSANKGGKRVTAEQWDLRAANAGVRWAAGTPESTTSRTPVICIKCGHSWSPLPSNISKGAGCARCAKNSPQPQSVWDERALAVGLRWIEPVKGRHAKAKAECIKCSYKWTVDAGGVAGGAGCPNCGSETRSKSRHLGSEVWNERASQQNLVWLEQPTNNSIKKLIRCNECKYEWKTIPSSIQSGAGCPVCNGVVVEDSTWEARAAAVHIRWLEIPKSSRRPTPAKCLECGLLWKANPSGITSGSGCPDCAETGYKVGQPGMLYFVERSASNGGAVRKIGITNISSSKVRLTLWKNQGFELKYQKTHINGQVILNLEQNLLKWLRRDLNLPPYLTKEQMPKGGATETFSPDEPSEFVLLEKIEIEYLKLSSEIDPQE